MLNYDLLDGETEPELRGYLVWHGLVEDVFDS